MSQAYALHVLKVAVAKICQTIGWHSTHTTTIDLLIDVTQHFLREISRIMMRYCELYNRTEPNLDDLALAYRDIGINMQELMEYIQFVDPIALPFAVPRFPLPRESNLNFLKPGSREMMMRPLHIPMYMPPMFPELEDVERADGGEIGHDEALVRMADASGVSLPTTVIDGGEVKLVDEGATLTEITIDETGEKMDTSETVTLGEDGALAPEALVNEEVEIPMQTLEIKEAVSEQGPPEPTPPTPPPPPPLPPLPPVSADGAPSVTTGEPDATGAKRPEPQAEPERQLAAQGDAAGGKSNAGATVGEGRPTRSISSVIMTTSGFISPAREGKLPDSRIPIIPEERPPRTLQPPPALLCAPPAALPVSAGVGAASAQAVSAPASSVSGSGVHPAHAALLPTLTQPANPRDHKHGSVSATAATTTTTTPTPPGGGLAVGTTFAVHAATAPGTTSSSVKQPGKKVKKKPTDRDRKKGDKKGAHSLKGEKLPGSERASSAKPPPPVGELPAGDGKEWSAMHASAALPPVDAAAGTGQPSVATVAPFLSVATGGVPSPAAFSATSTLPTDGATVPGKPVKPSKTKVRKEKGLLKKRKVLPPPPTADAGPTFPTADAITLTPTTATTATTTATTTPELFDKLQQPPLPPVPSRQPKVKSSTKRLKQAKKLQALQAGGDQQTLGAPSQLEQVPAGAGPNQPPPLIDPWRVAALSGEKLDMPSALAPAGDGAKPRKQKAPGKQPKGELQVTEQAAQLSLLQKMHPSLEITTSPAPDPPLKHSGSGKKSGTKSKVDGKGHRAPTALPPAAAVPPFAPDREVIVIDDDKSPPHTPAPLMASPGATEGKKQRKPTPGGAFFGHEHGGLGAGPAAELASPPGAGPLSFRDFSSPELHASAIPKTPDIKLPSSSSSSDAGGRAGKSIGRAARLGDMLPEGAEAKPAESIWTANRTLLAGPSAPEKKQKRAKQKPPKGSTDGAKQPKLQQPQQQPEQEPAGAGQGQEFGQPGQAGTPSAASRNPFALFGPGGPAGFGPYNNYLNQSLSARMPFGLFPFPSGPGLIPDGPLFPLQPGPYPMGPGNFPMPTNPFALPGIGTQINNLLRLPRPLSRPLGGGGSGSLNPYQNPYDDSIDTETKLAQTPLDLQKSNCNVAPLVPPSLFQEVTGGEESLNLSLKLGSGAGGVGGSGGSTSTGTTKQTATVLPQKKTLPVGPTAATSAATGSNSSSSSSNNNNSHSVSFPGEQGGAQEPAGGSGCRPESRKEDQVVILPAASVLLGASPPQRSSVCVIDIDDSDGSQSTTTTEAKRKGAGKEHRKDRKLKDGKVKKKKDKKDKSRSKEREREQQLKELSAGTASSSAVMTMGMIGAEEALMEQLRKERKEKKEKRKDKLKKEKRKERERMLQAGATDQPVPSLVVSSSADTQAGGGGGGEPSGACTTVPKLIMKLGGSVTTPSPRSDTPDHYHAAAAAGGGPAERKRDGSPELARISALVTRPPKLKVPYGPGGSSSGGSSSSKSKKDDSPTKAAMGAVGPDGGGAGAVSADHGQTHGQAGFDASDTGKHSSGTGSSMGGGDAGDSAQAFGGGSGAPVASGTATSKGGSKAGRGVSLGGGVEYVSSSGSKASAGDAGGSRKAPKESGSSKSSKSSSSAHHHHHNHAAATTLAAPAHMTDADGNTVWICPACGRVDDGTPMIGCDGCDAWYHWVCVGIQVPPDDNEDWYCRVCIGKKQDSHTDSEKQRKRKKKDKKTPKD